MCMRFMDLDKTRHMLENYHPIWTMEDLFDLETKFINQII